MLMQDFSTPELHQVLARESAGGLWWTYTPCHHETAAPGSVTLRLWRPHIRYVAKSIVLRGPRLGTRATPALLKAELAGLSVATGAVVRTSLGSYTVVGMELMEGYKGVTLVGAACRIRLNDGSAPQPNRADHTALPIGLDKEQARLTAVIRFALQTRFTQSFVLVRGPRGCGVTTTVDAALACIGDEAVLVPWSFTFNAVDTSQSCNARVVVVRIHPLEEYFPAVDDGEALLARCKLESDVRILSDARAGGQGHSVVVVGSSHHYGSDCAVSVVEQCFTTHIVLALPDATLRAKLLATVRGGAAHDWAEVAHAMVGLSAAEVLEAARDPTWDRPAAFQKVEWSDIGGLREVKECLYKTLILPYRNPELFERFGLTPTKGMLLYGPPGCAKTTLIKALCSESYFH
ncbi:hypothetical protein STCU_07497 [Strigomonas culicis]|uniref:ATPase AAA-type core domain-containing protein n=1 Tax=Strigomonas culicis TaxID=28005 RepID=S9U475_9TRYP|nr:hypothetical protein STCU_07497 [Strigomonas culicis]|eukprot:EPY23743.1 hypothetical protein STCU_07497 [Strigomonas culicis]